MRWPELQELVEKTGIPFYTTPQGRGVVPDDHEYSYLTMRSTAFNADFTPGRRGQLEP